VKSKGVVVATDRLGSVRANSSGESFRYYPYGEDRTATPDNREKFGTYTRDNPSQDYADQRYYGVGTGRFNTPDPYKASAGAGDPGSWNRYSYVEGDPVNFGDLAGLARCSAVGMATTHPDPDNALAVFTTWEIQCTSNAGSVFAWQSVTFPNDPSDRDAQGAMDSLASTVDQAERANFMNVILASRGRVLTTYLSNNCAQAIGADDADAAKLRLNRMEISLSATGPLLRVTTNPAGNITGVEQGQNLATWQMGVGFTFNSSVDWSAPGSTFAVDQNGVQRLFDVLDAEAFRVGAASITANQFVDLMMLHELAHSFGQNHGDDDASVTRFQRNIWSSCFQ
jgi:RHS repeat-associated protein